MKIKSICVFILTLLFLTFTTCLASCGIEETEISDESLLISQTNSGTSSDVVSYESSEAPSEPISEPDESSEAPSEPASEPEESSEPTVVFPDPPTDIPNLDYPVGQSYDFKLEERFTIVDMSMFKLLLTDEEMDIVFNWYDENSAELNTPENILPYAYYLIKKYNIPKEELYNTYYEAIDKYGDTFINNTNVSKDYIETLYLPTEDEIRQAAKHPDAYYHDGALYSYYDICSLSVEEFKSFGWTDTDVTEYLDQVLIDEYTDVTDSYFIHSYNIAFNYFLTKLHYGYDLRILNYTFDYAKVYNVKVIQRFLGNGDFSGELGDWYDKTYNNEIYATFCFSYYNYVNNEEDKGKIFTNFSSVSAPIMLYVLDIPREDLEKALDEEEAETGKRTYTVEDLDVLYSLNFDKMESQFLSQYGYKDGHYVLSFSDMTKLYLYQNNSLSRIKPSEFDAENTIEYLNRMKAFFHEHNDTRYDEIIDYNIECMRLFSE